ncbi:uncharacterized protein LOC108295919 [Cebus imitator]|uniref:uncharacterized protein LOC108295919 n=1 Tax=Cebus imitator TaxID=2715852 RepID=UPI00080A7488|nr:uncharacterized protein LOC108295919 [Cebus imitator]
MTNKTSELFAIWEGEASRVVPLVKRLVKHQSEIIRGFFALHFTIARLPFSHRNRTESNLQNANIPSPVLLCRHLAVCAGHGAARARSPFPQRPPAARTRDCRQAIHHPPSSRRASSVAAAANPAAGGAAPEGQPAASLRSLHCAWRARDALVSHCVLQGQNETVQPHEVSTGITTTYRRAQGIASLGITEKTLGIYRNKHQKTEMWREEGCLTTESQDTTKTSRV